MATAILFLCAEGSPAWAINITSTNPFDFGRVFLGQEPATTVGLTKGTPGGSFNYNATPSNSGLSPGSGSFASGGSGNASSFVLGLANNPFGSGSAGSKSFTVTIAPTSGSSPAAGLTVNATIAAPRTVSASAVDLGAVFVGETTAPQVSSLTSPGADNANTRVTVLGTLSSDGEATAAAGTDTLFDGSTGTTRSVSGQFASAGAKSGSLALAVNGEGLTGETVNPVSIGYSAQVFDRSQASFAATPSGTLLIDFGTVNQNDAVGAEGFSIHNLEQTAGFTAGLDLTGIVGSGDVGVLGTDLALFSNLDAGTFDSFSATFDTTNSGVFYAEYSLTFLDQTGIQGAPLMQNMTLEIIGTVLSVASVPEPGTWSLALIGLIGFGWSAHRRIRPARRGLSAGYAAC